MDTTTPDDELSPNTVRPDDSAGQSDKRTLTSEEKARLDAMMSLMGYEDTTKRKRPRADEPREDVKRNRAEIRKVMLRYIKNEHRAATVQEICDATGLSDKTVKAHRRHIKLGDGKPNMYQHLTHDVMMAIYKKARGYTYDSEKLITVSQGSGLGSNVERHDILMSVQPDMTAAKLWVQMVEGFQERSETKHSGTVSSTGPSISFNYIVPTDPATDGK